MTEDKKTTEVKEQSKNLPRDTQGKELARGQLWEKEQAKVNKVLVIGEQGAIIEEQKDKKKIRASIKKAQETRDKSFGLTNG